MIEQNAKVVIVAAQNSSPNHRTCSGRDCRRHRLNEGTTLLPVLIPKKAYLQNLMDLFGRNELNVDHGFHRPRRHNQFPAIGPFRHTSIFLNYPSLIEVVPILQKGLQTRVNPIAHHSLASLS
jgi:hypothetical protein